MVLQQRLQHLAALGGEAEALRGADRLGMAERIRGAAPMVVLAMFQDWADRSAMRAPRL